jgi:hypothetical protein
MLTQIKDASDTLYIADHAYLKLLEQLFTYQLEDKDSVDWPLLETLEKILIQYKFANTDIVQECLQRNQKRVNLSLYTVTRVFVDSGLK